MFIELTCATLNSSIMFNSTPNNKSRPSTAQLKPEPQSLTRDALDIKSADGSGHWTCLYLKKSFWECPSGIWVTYLSLIFFVYTRRGKHCHYIWHHEVALRCVPSRLLQMNADDSFHSNQRTFGTNFPLVLLDPFPSSASQNFSITSLPEANSTGSSPSKDLNAGRATFWLWIQATIWRRFIGDLLGCRS